MFSILEKGIMRFVAIDLEIEQPITNPQVTDSRTLTEKIIQLGVVVFELGEKEPNIIHSETMFLNYNRPLSTFIKQLTGITDEEVNSSENNSHYALKRIGELMEMFDTDRKVVEWGAGDLALLKKESGYTNEYIMEMGISSRSSYNAKVLFQCYAMMNGLNPKGGLSKSMAKLRLGFKCTRYNGENRGAHWAETDALNTAIIFNEIMQRIKK